MKELLPVDASIEAARSVKRKPQAGGYPPGWCLEHLAISGVGVYFYIADTTFNWQLTGKDKKPSTLAPIPALLFPSCKYISNLTLERHGVLVVVVPIEELL